MNNFYKHQESFVYEFKNIDNYYDRDLGVVNYEHSLFGLHKFWFAQVLVW